MPIDTLRHHLLRIVTVFILGNVAMGAPFVMADAVNKTDAFKVMVLQLLTQADVALSAGRLTTPSSDNAFDKYQAVLLIEPDNLHAKAGLLAVQQRYFELAEDALGRGRLAVASDYLRVAQDHFGADTKLTRLQQLLQKKRAALAVPAKVVPQDVQAVKRLSLDRKALQQRSDEIKTLLAQVAARVQSTDESIMIYSMNDAQGRWIYQTMKSFAPDYLIRGDIRLHSQPAVEFLEPLN